MYTPDKLLYFYCKFHNRKGIHPYVFTPIRRFIRKIARKYIPQYYANNPIVLSQKVSDVIVSLTSFPGRINEVYIVIQSMLRQTILPQKIILWLSKEQLNESELPENLKSLENDIFNIRFVDGDIRSHKKYYYVLSEFPNNKIIIVDDDLFYPSDMIEKMLFASDKYPNRIICRYGSIAKYSNDNSILPYNDWWNEIVEESDNQNFFFGSGGGILLTKDMLFKDILNLDLSLKLTPLADDIWLNAMINLANTPKHKIHFGIFIQIQETQEYKLSQENVDLDMNTKQLNDIIDHYTVKYNINPFPNKSNY